MKLNKKGFTLVELLAVIVVLGIIALIGYGAISETIVNTRIASAQATAINFEAAAKTYCSTKMMLDNGEMSTSATVNEIDFDDNETLEVAEIPPTTGEDGTSITFSNNCKTVTINKIKVGTYTCSKDSGNWKCE